MARKRLLVLGARDYAPVFADSFEGVRDYRVVGFVENLDHEVCTQTILGLPVHWIDDLERLKGRHWAICCLGTTLRAGFIQAVAALALPFATLVHPSSTVSRRSSVAEGTSIDAGAVVAGFSNIGAHVRVGRGATIGHHVTVREYSTIHPGVNIASGCDIGPTAIVGIGATILPGCRIGSGSFVAGGALVSRDVPDRALVAGVPACVVKTDYGPR